MQAVRGHREGTIYQRADGRKVAAVSLRDGRRASRYCTHRHKPEERDKPCPEIRSRLRDLLKLREAGDRAVTGSRLTLGVYLRSWLDDVMPSLAPATWRKHASICRVHLIPDLGHRRLSDLSVGHVRTFLAAGSLDPQTRRHHRATLRRALADAVRDGYVTRNVAALAEPPALATKERTILDAAQVRTLIEGTKDDRLHALWVLLATTGLRSGEALGLEWANVGPSEVRVEWTLHRIPHAPKGTNPWELRPPKTKKSRRTVFLPAVTAKALQEHKRKQLEEWLAAGRPGEAAMVFVRPDGRPYHGSKLTTLLYPILARLKLPKVACHDLRHSAATILYAAGVPLEAIADMLGHSTTRVTGDLYRHRVVAIQREAADVMGREVG